MKEMIIEIDEEQLFGEDHLQIPKNIKMLDLSVDLASKYD